MHSWRRLGVLWAHSQVFHPQQPPLAVISGDCKREPARAQWNSCPALEKAGRAHAARLSTLLLAKAPPSLAPPRCPRSPRFYGALASSGVVGALIALCRDPDHAVRKFACFAIGNAGER